MINPGVGVVGMKSWLTVAYIAAVVGGGLSANAEAQTIACDGIYAVQRGDTLGTISQAAYGTTQRFRELYAANRDVIGPDINTIEIGMVLRVPCDPNAPTETATAGTEGETDNTATRAIAVPGARVEIVFNKAAAPRYILNAGIIDPFLADIRRVTQGRVTFAAPAAVNRDPSAQLDLVRSGAADGAYMFNGLLAETHPLVQVTMNPMTGGTGVQTAVALWRVHNEFFRKAGTFDDVHLLGFVGAPPAQIWQVSDLSNPPPADNGQEPVNAALAVTQFDAADSESAAAVRAGIANKLRQRSDEDAAGPENFALTYGIARAAQIWRDADGVTEVEGGIHAPTFSVFISKSKWDEISPADQQAITDLAGEALAQRSAIWDNSDAADKTAMQRQGLTVIAADAEVRADLQDSARVGWERWIDRAERSGISGFAAIEAFFSEMRELREKFPAGS